MALNNCALQSAESPACARTEEWGHPVGYSNCFVGGCLFTDSSQHYFYIAAEDYNFVYCSKLFCWECVYGLDL